jgi:2-haloacid dehalogenase
MQKVKGLFFDVGGTVFDWKSTVKERIQELADRHGEVVDSEAFAVDWRQEMFKVHTEVRLGNLPWINSDGMHLRALENMAVMYPLLNKIDRERFIKATWHNLKAFDGAAQSINRLREKYMVVVLTILSFESIVSSAKAAGVQWDGILSCEFLGYYKPSLQAYRKAVSLLGLQPSEAMMVAAHPGDLAAAQAACLHTAYVGVPEKDHVEGAFGEAKGVGFDIEVKDFEELCLSLGV